MTECYIYAQRTTAVASKVKVGMHSGSVKKLWSRYSTYHGSAMEIKVARVLSKHVAAFERFVQAKLSIAGFHFEKELFSAGAWEQFDVEAMHCIMPDHSIFNVASTARQQYDELCDICHDAIHTSSTNKAIKFCDCRGTYHFTCVKTFIKNKGCPDYFSCPKCQSTIVIPKVYYASKINNASLPEDCDVEKKELMDYRELKRPFHYRIGHWALRCKHAGEDDIPIARSLNQITECDYVLADLRVDAQGTIAEVGVAWGLGKPVFLQDRLDDMDYKYVDAHNVNGETTIVSVGHDEAYSHKPEYISSLVITKYADIWFAQGIADKTLELLRADVGNYDKWLSVRQYLPNAMRVNEVRTIEDSIRYGHYTSD